MTASQGSASQAGQRVENGETSLLEEKLGPEGSALDMQPTAPTLDCREG